MARFNAKRAEMSLVTVYRRERAAGMGVFVGGGVILTAAHCLPGIPDPDNPYGDIVRVRVHPHARKLNAHAIVTGVDTCSDLAILSDSTAKGTTLDAKGGRQFRNCLEYLRPAQVFLDCTLDGATIPVRIRTHKKTWVSAKATLYVAENRFFDLEIDRRSDPIRGGTSGSPLFDEHGRVIGLVSSASDAKDNARCATAIRLAMALPGWFSHISIREYGSLDKGACRDTDQ